MPKDDSSGYLRLSQFLELQSQWHGARDVAELCHRICRSASLLLTTPSVAIGLAVEGKPYGLVAGEGRWMRLEAQSRSVDSLLRNARATGIPQLRAKPEETVGIFPFRAPSVEGCLHVSVPRPVFQSREITFLRFLASLCGITLSGRAHIQQAVAAAEVELAPPDAQARRYVAMAVHDLRNPLNVVAGYTALLQENSLGSLTEEQREAVEAIGRQCQVLLSAVDQLIELDRLGCGRREISTSRFVLGGLFEDLRATCFPGCNGQIRWPGPEAAFEVQSDRRRLFSIVQNLIDNALKHAPGGEVIVDCTRVNGNLVIDVRDGGPGLDAELRAQIVAQAQTGREVAPRSGLGLYTVASHVHALGGSLNVECSDAGGTTIRVSIPPERAGRLLPSADAAPEQSPAYARS